LVEKTIYPETFIATSFAFENSASLWRGRLMIATIRETVVTVLVAL